MPISFIGLVNLVLCKNVEKYGVVLWRMSCDLLSVWKKKRGKGRSPLLLLGGGVILRQCHRLLQPTMELTMMMRAADNATRGYWR
jgi:hypothetical protein